MWSCPLSIYLTATEHGRISVTMITRYEPCIHQMVGVYMYILSSCIQQVLCCHYLVLQPLSACAEMKVGIGYKASSECLLIHVQELKSLRLESSPVYQYKGTHRQTPYQTSCDQICFGRSQLSTKSVDEKYIQSNCTFERSVSVIYRSSSGSYIYP